MRHPLKSSATAVALGAGLLLGGCGTPTDSKSAPVIDEAPPATVDVHDDHEHAHPSEGPHHGGLVELGNEEYHAEVIHDGAAGTVTVYVLDGSAKAAVPIDATDITINVTHDGTPEQFKLAATPDAADPSGKSSRFALTNKELGEHLDEEGATAKLVLTIDGKSYTGLVEHHHEHEHADGHKH